MTRLVWTLVGAGAGALVAGVTQVRVLAAPPEWSLRTNVSGRRVAAVLGGAVFAGAVAGALVVKTAEAAGVIRDRADVLAALIVFVPLALAGAWDDRRGDEAARGFRGHLGARRLTGGIVKIAAGGAAGLAAAALLHREDLPVAALTALAIPLCANLFNLLDRAPGRAGKTALLLGLPLLALGDAQWAVAAAGAFGALATVLPADLGERGMLGDAGANPIGGLIGLGLADSLGRAPLAVVVVVLLLLNAASERWSFSKVIEETPLLRKLDAIGRK